jgi:hypothetical protein
MSFIGNKDVDRELMMHLNDRELGLVCAVNRYAKSLCDEPIFWRNRIMRIFGITNENINELIENYKFDTPRALYIYLRKPDNKYMLPWMITHLRIVENDDYIIQHRGVFLNRYSFYTEVQKKYPNAKLLTAREFRELTEIYRR